MKTVSKLFFVLIVFLISYDSYSQKRFSPSELILDIDSLNKKILEIHPNPFTKIDSITYFKEISRIKLSIDKPLTGDEFYRLLAPITIKIGDGHTGLNPDQNQMIISKLRFPFDVFIQDKHMFIIKNYSVNNEILAGSEILKINGIATNEILSTLLKYIPGESERFTMAAMENFFPMAYRFVYGDCNKFSVEIKRSGKVDIYEVNTLTNEQQKISENLKPSRLYFKNNVAVIDLRNFSSSDFTAFIDSVFTQISNKNVGSLIIDLRYNGGGEASLADSLISYLTPNEYQSMQSDLIKISYTTTDYIQQLQSMNWGEKRGRFYVCSGMTIKPINRRGFFNGSIYVLTSSMTYSTAGFFANVVKCYKIGTIIGSETGQPMIAYGDTYNYFLPNSNLSCAIAKQKFVLCCARTEGQGVIPDYIIKPNLTDRLKGIDTEMNFTLRLIENKK
jgi:hypothetical protein